jgi:GNAT superfamily N-acetyltransferase
MTYREAYIEDIPQLSAIRLSVKENVLSNPALVTENDYVEYLTVRGKGWVCEIDGSIVGFSIGDLQDHNVWALFIQPGYEGKGIGRELMILLLQWYFANTDKPIWLSTAPGSRAEEFYRIFGWRETGRQKNGEILFELSAEEWQ